MLNKYGGPAILQILKMSAFLFEKPTTKQRIVILKFVGLGDTVLMMPIILMIRKSFPEATIVFLGTPITKHLFLENQNIDKVIVYDVLSNKLGIIRFLQFIRIIRTSPPSVFIDFTHNLFLTTIVGVLSGAKLRLGLIHRDYNKRGKLFTDPVPYDDKKHLTKVYYDIYQQLCDMHQITSMPYKEILNYTLPVKGKSVEKVQTWKIQQGIQKTLIGIHPGCGPTGTYRKWPTKHYLQLIQRLLEKGCYQIILTGGASETKLIESIKSRFPHNVFLGNIFDFDGFVALIKSVDCFISADTGPAHIGSWVGTKTIVLFGPNLPERYGPIHKESKMIYHPIPCSPCIQVHKWIIPSECCNPDKSACMYKITVDEVFETVELIVTKTQFVPE